MFRSIKQLVIGGLLVSFFAVPLTHAREANFTPAVAGDRALVTEEGSLQVLTDTGDLMNGFPVEVSGEVFSSSPVFADLNGDSTQEVLALTRNISDDSFTARAYDLTGSELASAAIGGSVYFDPVVLNSSSKQNVLVFTEAGDALELSYTGASTLQSSSTAFGEPVGAHVDASQQILLNFPLSSKIGVYTSNGNQLLEEETHNISDPILYPLVSHEGFVYGVTANKKLVAINSSNGNKVNSFTLSLNKWPLSSPVLTDVQGDSEPELVLLLEDHTRMLVDLNGNIISDSLPDQSFANSGGDSAENEQNGVFSSWGEFANQWIQTSKDVIASLFSRSEFEEAQTGGGGGPTIPPGALLYENAEDGDTVGWDIYDADPTGATINNVYENEEHGQVIEFNGYYTGNGYRLRLPDSSWWANTTHHVLQWDMKYQSGYHVYVIVDTNKGKKTLRYSFADEPNDPANNTYFFNIGDLRDGEWHTLTRNLQSDLNSIDSEIIMHTLNSIYFRGNGRVDNIMALEDTSSSSLSGQVLDDSGSPIEGVRVSLWPSKYSTLSDSNGNYSFPEIPQSLYHLNLFKLGYYFSDNSIVFSTSGSETFNTTGLQVPYTLYEDAENGNTFGWQITDNDPSGASVQNINDPEHGQVIEFTGESWKNSFKLSQSDDSPWRDSKFLLQWDMNYDDIFTFIVEVNTTTGLRKMFYRPTLPETTYNQSVHVALGYLEGGWTTITRSLQEDMSATYPDTVILSVESFTSIRSGRVDNILLMEDGSSTSISGVVTDENTSPVPNAAVQLLPGGELATTDAFGYYEFTAIPKRSYILTVESPDLFAENSEAFVNTETGSQTQDFTGIKVTSTIYEDGEDGETLGWIVTDNDPSGATIANVYEDSRFGNVIEFQGAGWDNAYMKRDDNDLNFQSTQTLLSWDMNTEVPSTIYAWVKTDQGNKFISYNPWPAQMGVINSNVRIYIPAQYLNTWKHSQRDLQKDLNTYLPGATIEKVNRIYVRGNGKIDNILLSSPTGGGVSI